MTEPPMHPPAAAPQTPSAEPAPKRRRGPPPKEIRGIIKGLRPLATKISRLTPDPKNARAHDERSVDALKRSLADLGQHRPIVVQKQGMIVRAGNGLLEAAKALGWNYIAALIVDEDDTAAIKRALTDNRTAELSTWDDGILLEQIVSMRGPAQAAALGRQPAHGPIACEIGRSRRQTCRLGMPLQARQRAPDAPRREATQSPSG